MSSVFKQWVFIIIALPFLLTSCHDKGKKYVIGVSQCSSDVWRDKLREELVMATYLNDGVEIKYACAYDDPIVQARQIDSLVNEGINLLVVSPEQMQSITPAINNVYDKNIPVILFDRKTDSEKYTAFMGADNYLIGELIGKYVAERLGGKGNIVEIGGRKTSSPAIERTRGFRDVIDRYPDLHIVGYDDTDWTPASGEKAMRSILKQYTGRIDCVFGGNDRMAVAARKVMKRMGRDSDDIIYVGVDALPGKDGGMQQIEDGILSASAIYPTHGDEIVNLAVDIIEGCSFEKENLLQTVLVTKDNARLLLMQNEELTRKFHYLEIMHQRIDKTLQQLGTQNILLYTFILITIVVSVLLIIIIRAYRQKHVLNISLEQEKEKVERQRDELEEQRDKLIEANLANERADDASSWQEPNVQEESSFMRKFDKVVKENISDSDLSVEAIGSKMGFSRVQLYRKVKALTGMSPVEYVRKRRLDKARTFLSDTSMSISETAYKVGFSSPSYFTKCYKDEFGENPKSSKEIHNCSTQNINYVAYSSINVSK